MSHGKKHRDVKPEALQAVLERAKTAPLAGEDYEMLKAAMETLVFLQQELLSKGASIERLRQMVFGVKTEKTENVFGKGTKADEGEGSEKGKKPPTGHGRNGAAAYQGAIKVKVPHPSLKAGENCKGCLKGKLYPVKEPSTLVRVQGAAPIRATVYECEKLRCNLCGEVLTAPAPAGVGGEKYDETATSMVGLLKYGTGLPFNRIEKLQQGMGIPLPATTQWELVKEGAELLTPVHEELIEQAAAGDVLHNDDTTMKVLALSAEQRAAAAADEKADERTGVFTSGIVSTGEGKKVALFFTGVHHAGENLSDVLSRRQAGQKKPIQMCDALSRNTSGNASGDFETLLANCMAHSRRKYVEVAEAFPEECRFVLETLRDVYKHDATAQEEKMSPEERLKFHQENSGPLMAKLEEWMAKQFNERKVEPNSGLGEAIAYMQKHWSKLTLFLKEPGAPLDNNICERALKKAILHRKNSLFYKTLNGARVGDVFMSLIHSAELNGQAPFEYLVALLRHHERVAAAPGEWMPWNYAATLARSQQGATLLGG